MTETNTRYSTYKQHLAVEMFELTQIAEFIGNKKTVRHCQGAEIMHL